MLSTAGCWDRIEINERIFVLGLAIDKFEPGKDVKPAKMVPSSRKKGRQLGRSPEPFGG